MRNGRCGYVLNVINPQVGIADIVLGAMNVDNHSPTL